MKTPAAIEDAKEGWCCCCCFPGCNKTATKIQNKDTLSSEEIDNLTEVKEKKMIKCCCFNIKKRTVDTDSDSLPAIDSPAKVDEPKAD